MLHGGTCRRTWTPRKSASKMRRKKNNNRNGCEEGDAPPLAVTPACDPGLVPREQIEPGSFD